MPQPKGRTKKKTGEEMMREKIQGGAQTFFRTNKKERIKQRKEINEHKVRWIEEEGVRQVDKVEK
jgi:hypothetical protein